MLSVYFYFLFNFTFRTCFKFNLVEYFCCCCCSSTFRWCADNFECVDDRFARSIRTTTVLQKFFQHRNRNGMERRAKNICNCAPAYVYILCYILWMMQTCVHVFECLCLCVCVRLQRAREKNAKFHRNMSMWLFLYERLIYICGTIYMDESMNCVHPHWFIATLCHWYWWNVWNV